MKKSNVLFLVMLAALATLLTGCGTSNWSDRISCLNGSYRSPNEPISTSELPPTPLRRRETLITSLDGSYNYYHTQGTTMSVSKSYDLYSGPRTDFNQTTYNTTSETYTPMPRFVEMRDDPHGPKAGSVSGYVPLKPLIQSPIRK